MTTPQDKPELAIVEKTNVLPMLSPAIAAQRASIASEIIRLMLTNGVLQKGRHFGEVPGTNNKNVLLKPGAELLCKAFGYAPTFYSVTVIEDWDKKLFFYRMECKLVDTATGIVIATGIGSCNSYESKYRYRWLYDNQLADAGLTKDSPGVVARTKNKRGGGGTYTQYRIENDDIFSLVNTIDKMAQKRALIAASLIGTGASEFFTQDIEDIPQFGGLDDDVVDAEPITVIEPDPMDYIRLGIRTGIGDDAITDSEMCKLLDIDTLTKDAIKAKYEGKTAKSVVQIALDAFEAAQPKAGQPVPVTEATPEAAKSEPVQTDVPPQDQADDAPATGTSKRNRKPSALDALPEYEPNAQRHPGTLEDFIGERK